MSELIEMTLARVIDACGKIEGRVKMQKIVYLLKAMGYDIPFDDFRIRQLGPYSRMVAFLTDSLKDTGIAVEERENKGLDRLTGESVIQYSYSLTESGKKLARKYFDIPNPKGKPPIDESAQELNRYDRPTLEVAATKIFLERKEGLTGDKLAKELESLKGHLKRHFKKADRLIEEMREKQWL